MQSILIRNLWTFNIDGTREKSVIDTPTESVDENLQLEWENYLRKILTEEL